jgi:alkylglycerol monooxygenase
VLATGLWAVGAAMQGRLSVLEVLLIECAALATATSALGLTEWHHLFKPLAMVLAIACVADRMKLPASRSVVGCWLVAGLAFSLLGDCFLMFPGFFMPGLVAFLAAHLCYIALLKQGVGWLPSRRAVFLTLGFGAAMYAFIFPGLSPVLRVAVAAYVLVIAVMAAQAIGRATVLRERASWAVALGALIFMLSDSLLAVNKFAFPLPMAQFWILATYYVAQILIACNTRATAAGSAAHSVNNSPALLGGVTPR